MTTSLSSETLNVIEALKRQQLERKHPLPTENLDTKAVTELLDRIDQLESEIRAGARPRHSIGRTIRGICALRGTPLPQTTESEITYAKSLQTGATPGQYLVESVQANQIIAQLAQLAVARAAGAVIVPMAGIQKLNIPAAVANSPTFVWQAQNSKQTPSDPNAAQVSFDLKLQQALVLLPLQLFRAAKPSWDVIFEDAISLGLSESEDQAMMATSTLANAPTALMSASGISTINCSGANGGNLAAADLLATLQKAIDLKVRPPYVWFMAGRTVLRLLSLGTTSQPYFSFLPESAGGQVGHLFGWPIFATASIATNEQLNSGSNQSHAILTTPRSIFVAESGEVSLEASMSFALEAGEVALRIGHKIDFGYSPAASLCVLVGIN